MIYFIFTKSAKKILSKLPDEIKTRILSKLKILKNHPDIFTILKKLTKFKNLTYRLRIGNFRLILSIKSQNKSEIIFLIIDLGHRRDIYK